MTRVVDAVAAAQLGADAVGIFLHGPSSRKVGREVARQIVEALPPFVMPVGLFVDAPPELIVEIATDLGLRHLQLHGQEPPSLVASLRAWTIVKAVHVRRETFTEDLKQWRGVPNLRGVLLETAGQSGGSGVENDWETIQAAKQRGEFEDFPPIIAAGGLRPDNVARVVRLIRPYAVDVSSGIESERGIKSVEKMREFVRAVRESDLAP
jgi:phosphoribosylanthranilate isomerase